MFQTHPIGGADVRAVLTSIREPSPEVIEAGAKKYWDPHSITGVMYDAVFRAAWQAAIDHILAEKETKG